MKGPGILITLFLSKFTVKQPINTFLYTIPFYTTTAALSCLIVQNAEEWVSDGSIIWYLVAYELLNRVAASCVYLSASALHFKVAQPDIGATYLTLLNSFFNLGGVWVETASLKWIGYMDRDVEKMPKCYCDQYKDDYSGTCYKETNETIVIYHSNIENYTDVQNNNSLPIVLFDDTLNDTESEWDSYFSLAIIAVSVGKTFFHLQMLKEIYEKVRYGTFFSSE